MPVAVQVEDDPRVALREHAAEPHGGDVVRAVHDHRIGLEVPQLARDAHRQREVEDEPVERTRTHGLHQVEGVVARRGRRQQRSPARGRRRRDSSASNFLRVGSSSGSRYRVRPTNRMRKLVHPALSSESTTSARMRAAYSSGVAYHCSEPSRATNPRPAARSRLDRTLNERARESAGVVRWNEHAVLAVADEVLDPAAARRRRPRRPRQNASTTTRPMPSRRDGSTSTSRASSSPATSSGASPLSHVTLGPRSTSVRARSSRAPAPISRSSASGSCSATCGHASTSRSSPL